MSCSAEQRLTSHELQLSTLDTAQISCFASDLSAPIDDFTYAIYDFCLNDFPTSRIINETSVSKTFALPSGGTALISVDLDPAVTDWAAGDCISILAKDVTDCEINGQSTGGVYNPIGSGASQFTVEVIASSVSARFSAPSTSAYFNSTDSTSRLDQAVCLIKTAEFADSPRVPMQPAVNVVMDHCNYLDGRILKEGDEVPNTISWGGMSIVVSVRALRSTTIFAAGCVKSFVPILSVCHDSDWNFYGGTANDALAQFTIDVRFSASSSPEIRSLPEVTSHSFNSTNSTVSRLEAQCFGHAPDPPSVYVIHAIPLVSDFCNYLEGMILKTGDVRGIEAVYIIPNLYIQVRALRSGTIFQRGCQAAYDAILRTCRDEAWNEFGGMVVDPIFQWTFGVQFSDAASKNAANENILTISDESELPKRSAKEEDGDKPFNATESTHGLFTTQCNSFPWSEDPITISYSQAIQASEYVCLYFQGHVLAKGTQQPMSFPTTSPPLWANIIALDNMIVRTEDCRWAYDTLYKACMWDGFFYGGSVTIEPTAKWVLEIPPAGFTDASKASVRDMSPLDRVDQVSQSTEVSDLTTRSLADSDCDHNGASVDRSRAYNSAAALCFQAGSVEWAAGQGITHLYDTASPWISARIVATEQMSLTPVECFVSFAALIESCISTSRFCGGTLESQGAKYSLQVVPGSEASHADLHAINSSEASHPAGDASSHADDLTARTANGDPYSSTAECHPLSNVWVQWYQTFNAGIQFCRSLDGQHSQAGFEHLNVYQEGLVWVFTQLISATDMTVDYQTCIEMFDSAIRQCKNPDHTSGGSLRWGDLWVQYHATNRFDRTIAAISNGSDKGANVVSRQSNSCIRAESSPIDKHLAAQAIGQFCPQFSSKMIPANEFVSDTLSMGSIDIGMKVLATCEDGYLLHPQHCYGSFMALLDECSDGINDTTTNGGTLVGKSAAFTLGMAYL